MGYWKIQRCEFSGQPGVEDDYSGSYACLKLRRAIGSTETLSSYNKSIDANIKYTWTWAGPPDGPAGYNFTFDVRGRTEAIAYVDVASTAGKGMFVSHAYVNLIGDTATAAPVQNQHHAWAGAQYTPNSGGRTGTGEGSYESSIVWTDADPNRMDPSAYADNFIVISATDDNPGETCFVEISTEASVRCEQFRYTHRYTNEAGANGLMDDYYGSHVLREPQPL